MFVVGKKLFSITGTWASMTPANSSLASSTFVLLFPHVARWRTLDPTYCSACKHKGIQFQELEPKRGTQYQHTKKKRLQETLKQILKDKDRYLEPLSILRQLAGFF